MTKLKNQQTFALASVTRKCNEITNLMEDRNALYLVKLESDELNKLFRVYEKAHQMHVKGVTAQTEIGNETRRFILKKAAVREFQQGIADWITEAETHLVMDHVSASQVSKNSSERQQSVQSDMKTAQPKEQVKIAELTTAKELLQKQQKLKMEEESFKKSRLNSPKPRPENRSTVKQRRTNVKTG